MTTRYPAALAPPWLLLLVARDKPSLSIFDARGKPSLSLFIAQDKPSLSLCIARGKPSLSATASPHGDMISVQPVLRLPSRITPAGQAKA